MMKRLVVIDHSNLSVHFFDINTDRDIDISELGFKESQCSWMFGESIDIHFHKEVIR